MSRGPPNAEQRWINTQRWVSEFSTTEEFKLLHDLVTKDEATARDAVQQVDKMAIAATAARGTGRGVASLVDYNVSLSVLELAQQLEPTKQTKLVEFMSLLQQNEQKNPATGETLLVDSGRLFQDLPSFGYTELESWVQFGGAHVDPCDPDMIPEQKQRFANLNAFIAQLSQAADVSVTPPDQIHPLDKTLHAIWTMQKAFENKSRLPAELVDTAAMRAACMWFIYASDRLMDNVRSFRTFMDSASAGAHNSREEYASQGYKGYALGRWQLWRQGLGQALEACSDEETKLLIGDALAKMESAEKKD
ncbi:hypothetical protein PFICI_10964 [Pestalotiopsis fici W106-1]|uniref:Uncharacterized protein n=1 Tax=Pestalotiopsis fici (strain W106-1 / CGMCC3.15140) TaxID=1229662 RepID=W3WTB2_PESFW|nr:uncharacterized protein PFICI_10964 [Pestalotiopsis fici W106-1]ETS77090.1 hypothetical protein PFICI_10964 [Pestalotiopsis fici W106-1]